MIKKRKDDGKWLVNIKPGGRTGKQVKRVFNTQGEAKYFETWFKSQVHADPEWTPAKRDNRKFNELIELWYDSHGQGLAAGENTKARLLAMSAKMENPTASQLRARFDEYRQARIKEGKSLETVNREHAYARAVFNELKRLGQWTKDNPIAEIRQFKTQERALSFLAEEQITELLSALKDSSNPHALLIARIALSTGGRWGECEQLTKGQVRSQRVQFANTKSKKTRAVPVSKELAKEIADHVKKHPTETERLFESAMGAFISALDRTGIALPKGQATHVLRHTFASHFMINGGNILTLQKVLGHSTLTMTMRYAHLAPDHLQEVLNLNPLKTVARAKPQLKATKNFMKKVDKLPVQERVGIPLEESPKAKKKAPDA